MQFNGQTFISVFEQLFFTPKFFGLKMQKSTFLRKNGFESSFFIKLTFRWLQTGLFNLKNTKQFNFAYGGFLRIFKMLHFSKFFEIFEIHQYFLVKLLKALNFI